MMMSFVISLNSPNTKESDIDENDEMRMIMIVKKQYHLTKALNISFLICIWSNQ